MLELMVAEMKEKYVEARPDADIENPIDLGHFLKEVRVFLSALDSFHREVEGDASAYRSRFQAVTSTGTWAPTRFVSVARKKTLVKTVAAFFRRNPDVDFTSMDVIEACGLSDKKILSIRTYMRRFVDSGKIVRVRHGVYRARPHGAGSRS